MCFPQDPNVRKNPDSLEPGVKGNSVGFGGVVGRGGVLFSVGRGEREKKIDD
jgi:hypothetical protein